MKTRRLSSLVACGLLTTATLLVAPAQAESVAFDPYVALDPGSSARSTAIEDVTGDGRADVLLTTWYENDVSRDYRLWVHIQRPDGTLSAPVALATSGTYTSSMSLAVGDLDGDGDGDAAVSTGAGVELFLQTPGALLTRSWTVPVPGARDVEIADVSGDGLADLVINSADGVRVWWQINGDFMRSPRGEVVTPEAQTEIEVGDVTGDGRSDLVSAVGDQVAVRAGADDGSFAAPITYASGGADPWDRVSGLALGDADGDGTTDVVATGGGNRPNSWVAVHYQEPDGSLGDTMTLDSLDLPQTVELADVDGNGRQDLVVLHGGWNNVGVYLQRNDGGFEDESLHGVPYASHYDVKGLGIGDLSGDGRPDLAVADSNHGLVLLRGAGSADTTPPDVTLTSVPSTPHRSRSATVAFTVSEPATVRCTLDGAVVASPCTSPVSLTNLSQGVHAFAVQASDAWGNSDPSPATHVFSVEGPDTTITGGPTGTIRQTSASFDFSGGPGTSGFECSLNNGAWTPCGSGHSYAALTPATTYTFRVRALNGEGLYDGTAATRSFSVAPAADLQVGTQGSATTAKKGALVTFTTSVKNLGPNPAASATLSQALPAGLTFSSASTGCSLSQTTVRCTTPSVAVGSTWTVTVVTKVTATKGSLTTTTIGTSATWDPHAANDSGSATLKVGSGR